MDQEMQDRHEKQWDDYFAAYDASRKQLLEDEGLIDRDFGSSDAVMPPEWKAKRDHDREAWVKEWGLHGWRAEALKKQQREEASQTNAHGPLEVEKRSSEGQPSDTPPGEAKTAEASPDHHAPQQVTSGGLQTAETVSSVRHEFLTNLKNARERNLSRKPHGPQ